MQDQKRPLRLPRTRNRLLGLAFLLALLVFGGLLARMFLNAPAPPPPTVQSPAEAPRQLRDIILYFAAQDATGLVAEGREVEDCLEEQDCLLATVRALIHGPVGDLAAVLPPHAAVLSIRVEGALAEIDFTEDLVTGHPGGTQAELLTVYALADTLTANFPHLRQLRILVDGQPIDTLRGHVDLRQPVSADFSLVKTEAAPTGNLLNLPTRSEE